MSETQQHQLPFRERLTMDLGQYIKMKPGSKGGKELAYLSWSKSWEVIKLIDPEATVQVHLNENGLPLHYLPNQTALVHVSMTVLGVTHDDWFAVTDFRNQAIIEPSADQVANSIQRSKVRLGALHGVGLYLYQNEAGPLIPLDLEDLIDLETKARLDALVAHIKGLPNAGVILNDVKTRVATVYGKDHYSKLSQTNALELEAYIKSLI